MAGGAQEEDGGLISGINVTPLVDVCLVLLIIMMVTAKAIVSQQVPLDLPKAAKVDTKPQSTFGISVLTTGDVLVNNVKVDPIEKILPMAKEALAANAELRVTIQAQAAVPHGKVMRVVDLLKQAGIAKIAFGAVHADAEPGAVP